MRRRAETGANARPHNSAAQRPRVSVIVFNLCTFSARRAEQLVRDRVFTCAYCHRFGRCATHTHSPRRPSTKRRQIEAALGSVLNRRNAGDDGLRGDAVSMPLFQKVQSFHCHLVSAPFVRSLFGRFRFAVALSLSHHFPHSMTGQKWR